MCWALLAPPPERSTAKSGRVLCAIDKTSEVQCSPSRCCRVTSEQEQLSVRATGVDFSVCVHANAIH